MIDKVSNLITRANEMFPNGTQTMSKSAKLYVQNPDFPGFAESGHGCMMTCANGKEYIDFANRSGAGILDYDDKDIRKALKAQIDKGLTFSLPSVVEVELGQLVREVVPNAEVMRFVKNGSDTTIGAVRVARSYTHKDYILMPRTGYAGFGDTFAAVNARDAGMPKALKEFVEFFDYNDLNQLEDKLKTGKFACVIMEPVSLEAPKKDYLEGVRALCDQYHAVLVFDENITAFRWALGGCQEYYGVGADIVCLGKAMSNGNSISCVAGKAEYMRELENVFFSATHFSNALDMAGAVANIRKLRDLKDRIYPHIWKQGKKFSKSFNFTCKDLGIDAHTVGLAPRLNLKFNHADASGLKDLYWQEMMRNGVFMGPQIYTTWAIKPKHMTKIIEASNASLEIMAKAVKENNIDKYLEGERSVQVFKRQ